MKILKIKSIKKIENESMRVCDIKSSNGLFITSGGIITHNCDRMTPQAQDALKSYQETYSKNCRFIFTANTPERIIDPIKSRCLWFNFNTTTQEKPELMVKCYNRLSSILDAKGIPYEPKPLQQLIVKEFPDYRRIMNTLQSYATGYGKIDTGIIGMTDASIADVLVPLLKTKKFDEVRKYILETNNGIDDIYVALYRSLEMFDAKAIPSIVVILADYAHKNQTAMNKSLNLLACCVEIMNEMR